MLTASAIYPGDAVVLASPVRTRRCLIPEALICAASAFDFFHGEMAAGDTLLAAERTVRAGVRAMV
jgi:hypothetical protein